MLNRRRLMTAAALLACGAAVSSPAFSGEDLNPRTQRLSQFYDRLAVEDHWIAGQHVEWRTGDPDGRGEVLPGRHTHCSAFVAAAAARLGIYILRPPEHGQVLLANAQNEWLSGPGRNEGWRRLFDPQAAQQAANAGLFVVASYHSHLDTKPGHIAIVRPSRKPEGLVAEEGPDVIQAGTTNATRVSLRDGFAGHPHAWNDSEVDYYAHAVTAARLAAF